MWQTAGAGPGPLIPVWAGLGVLGVAFIFMALLSWHKWADIFVDFGLQLYIPWQLAAGRELYRDIAYISGGPLSQYYHALLFKACGVSLATLVVSNLAIAAALVVLIYEAFRRVSDVATATAIGLVIILGFAFAQYVVNGNYNYICPYLSETVHGLALSVLCVVLLSLWLVKGRAVLSVPAGLAFGLVFLTKPETFLALAVAAAAAFLLAFLLRARLPPRLGAKSAVGFAGGSLVPLLFFFLHFCSVGRVGDAGRAVAGAWVPILASGAPKNAFHQWCLGLDHPMHNAGVMLAWFLAYLVAVRCLAWSCCAFTRRRALHERVCLSLIPLGLVLGALDVPWAECGWVLPLATAGIGLHLAWTWWNRGKPARDARLILPMLWSVFALFLLLKIILHSRIWHYGFYLAMPAMALNVFYLSWRLPDALKPRGLHVALFRTAVFLILGVLLFRLVSHSSSFYRAKTFALGLPADRILTFRPEVNPYGAAIAFPANWLEQNTASNATLAVLPDGAMLNYLSRRPNPTPYTSFIPPEFVAHGETRILEAYRVHSPNYIVLIDRDSSEYGFGPFGQDPAYGARFMDWINQNYQTACLWGNEPLRSNHLFGVKLLKRKTTGG